MSRAFVNEDDQREAPFVPPRADLPESVPNYVTPEGLDELLQEKEQLLQELRTTVSNENIDKNNVINSLNIKLQLLENRILTAQTIRRDDVDSDEITFGADIILQIGNSGKTQKFRIVGVDEADIRKGKISFLSPLSRLLMHKKAGDTVILKLERGEQRFTILAVE